MSEEQNIDSDLWMLTFADLVMLLLTFFVLLLTMSSMDKKKFEDVFNNLKEAMGVLEFSGYGEVTIEPKFVKEHVDRDSIVVVEQELLQKVSTETDISTEKFNKMIKDDHDLLDIAEDERGIILTFHKDLLFEPGRQTIKKESYPVLDDIAEAIDNWPKDVVIMGHTDDIPIKTGAFPSNFELSAYRGLSVLAYFINEKGLSPSQFSVGGYGSVRPLYPNDTPEHRAANRRVEIIFKY